MANDSNVTDYDDDKRNDKEANYVSDDEISFQDTQSWEGSTWLLRNGTYGHASHTWSKRRLDGVHEAHDPDDDDHPDAVLHGLPRINAVLIQGTVFIHRNRYYGENTTGSRACTTIVTQFTQYRTNVGFRKQSSDSGRHNQTTNDGTRN